MRFLSPEEVCNVLKPLKLLALHAVATKLHLSKSQLLVDLQDLVSEVTDPEWQQFDRKGRSCPDLAGLIKIGEFGRFPTATNEFCPGMFSIDLVKAAQNTLRFLQVMAAHPSLRKNLSRTCTDRYPMFLKLQASNLELRLLPPADVAVVHFSHMLQSKEYRQFAITLCPGLEMLPHCCDWMFDGDEKALLKIAAVTSDLWRKLYREPYDLDSKGMWRSVIRGDSAPVFWKSLFKRPSAQPEPKLFVSEELGYGRHARDPRLQGSASIYEPGDFVDLDSVYIEPVAEVVSVDTLRNLQLVVELDSDWLASFMAAAKSWLSAKRSGSRCIWTISAIRSLRVSTSTEWSTLALRSRNRFNVALASRAAAKLLWRRARAVPLRAAPQTVAGSCQNSFSVRHKSKAAKLWHDEFAEDLTIL